MQANNIANNYSTDVSTTVPKRSSTCWQSFYQHGRKFRYHAPKSPYNRKYVKDSKYVQDYNANDRWNNDEHSFDDLVKWKEKALQWDPGGVLGEHINNDLGEKMCDTASGEQNLEVAFNLIENIYLYELLW